MKRLGAKLTLNRETVRELTDAEMRRAIGATDNIGCPYTTAPTCPKTSCAGCPSAVTSPCPQTVNCTACC